MKTNIITLRITRQILAAMAIFAMTMISAQGLFVQTAFAGGQVTNAQIVGIGDECVAVGDTVTVTASVSAATPPGKLDQYGYVIYWGDGQQYVSGTGFFSNNDPVNISKTHVYSSSLAGGTITVAVYHQSPNGQDGLDQASQDINICVTDQNNPPVITLNGLATIDLIIGDTYVEQGATADDVEDGDNITVTNITGTVDTNTLGTYYVNYNFTDSDGAAAVEVTRTVNVKPVITECNDGIDNDGDGDIDYPADTGCASSGDDSENNPPVITLTGNAAVDIIIGNAYTEDGATADDEEDGLNLPVTNITGTVDTNTLGTYYVNYNFTDSDGAAAVEVTRTVNVNPAITECNDDIDNDGDGLTDYPEDLGCSSAEDNDENTKPVITLTGSDPVNLTVGDSYTDAGATANDAEDGVITDDIAVGGDVVDPNIVGTYVITYNVQDSDGLAADQVTRTVNVNREKPALCSVEIVSDASAYVVEKDANAKLLTFIHSAWDAVITGASWIWGDDPVVDPSINETQTFQNKFGFVGTVTGATLYVASDNTHSATVNSNTSHDGGSTFAAGTSYDVTSEILQGNNLLSIAVTNLAQGTDPATNPAGVMYKLVIDGEVTSDADCAVAYEEPVDTYYVEGYVWEDEDQDDVWDEGESALPGWEIIATDGEGEYTTFSDSEGHYFFNLPAGTWTITEEVQDEWSQTFPNSGSHVVTVPEEFASAEDQSFFAAVMNLVVPTAYAQTAPTTYGPYNFGNVYVGSTSTGGGGGSSSPRCDLFEADRDGNQVTLNWETRSGSRVVITSNGDDLYETSDEDLVDEGEYQFTEPDAAEFELTVYRGSRSRSCTAEVLGLVGPTPQVAGEQTSVVPYGAPDTGAGGTSPVQLPSVQTASAIMLRNLMRVAHNG